MNVRIVFYHIGQILRVIAAFLVVPLFTSLVCGELTARLVCAFVVPMLVCLGIGFVLTRSKPEDTSFYAREGLLIVGFSWIIISLLGALPFAIGTFGDAEFADLSFIDWFFESTSGFTTTGSSILHATDGGHQIDLMYDLGYKGLLMWRSLTHWLGGMGVLVFVLAVLPSSSASGIHLMQAESTGPSIGKLVSRMRSTARILYVIYAVLTLVEILLLVIGSAFDGQMNFFHSVILSLGTAGTGGFAATSGSVGDFGLYVQIVVTVFMFLFGVNFNLYYMVLIGQVLGVFKREELRFYVLTLVTSMILLTFSVWLGADRTAVAYSDSFWSTLQYTSFTAVSLMTSTGYATVDFTSWPTFARALLLLLMFIGASAGSTGGGFKCSRFLILVKSAFVRCRKIINPRAVYAVKMDGKRLDDEVVGSVSGYFVVYTLILLLATLLISLDVSALGDNQLATAFSSALTFLNNIGPGITKTVGPSGDFFAFAPLTKLLSSLLMLFGRLEIYPILMLFSPKTYSRA